MLYELGYVSHPQEEAIVHSNSYQEKVTDGIESGLEKYFNKKPPLGAFLF